MMNVVLSVLVIILGGMIGGLANDPKYLAVTGRTKTLRTKSA